MDVDRISPVFDVARTLLVLHIKNGQEIGRSIEHFNSVMFHHLKEVLERLEIEVLICGAISKMQSDIIEACGIKLIPFIGGNIEDVIVAYLKGEEIVPAFLMPGCGRRHGWNTIGKSWVNNMEVRAMPKGNCGNKGGGRGSGQGGGCKGGGGCGGGGRGSGQGQSRGGNQGQGQGQNRGGNQGQGSGTDKSN